MNLNNLTCFNFYSGWRAVNTIYKNVLGSGISPQQVYVLELLDHNKPHLFSTIQEQLGIDQSALSNMLKRMEKSNLIIKNKDLTDKRVILLKLTQQGYYFREQLRAKYDALNKALDIQINGDELNHLKNIVKNMHHQGGITFTQDL